MVPFMGGLPVGGGTRGGHEYSAGNRSGKVKAPGGVGGASVVEALRTRPNPA
jgi:hypothetical protein